VPYRTWAGEPGLMIEVYLPKKVAYQGGLHEALKLALEDASRSEADSLVADYLLHRRSRLQRMIFDSMPPLSEERAGKIVKVFSGFSLYEVDGVFWTDKGEQHVFEERTQVLRLLFRPNYIELFERIAEEDLRAELMEDVRRFRQLLVSQNKDLLGLFERRENKDKPLSELQRTVLSAVKEWKENVMFFVFGYVVAKLTEIPGFNEEELWVTSFRNTVINVVKLPKE
jgi:hypothetical protein